VVTVVYMPPYQVPTVGYMPPLPPYYPGIHPYLPTTRVYTTLCTTLPYLRVYTTLYTPWVYPTLLHCRSLYYTPGVLAVVSGSEALGSTRRLITKGRLPRASCLSFLLGLLCLRAQNPSALPVLKLLKIG